MEISDIQPVSTGELYLDKIDEPEDLILAFESRDNAGDQIEMFLVVAEEKPPKQAIEIFGTVATNQLGPIQALSYQGFGKLPPVIKQAIVCFHLEQSQELFEILCREVRENQYHQNRHLACWSATQALKEIGFSRSNLQHPDGGNLIEPITRIQERIIEHKINEISRIQRLNFSGKFAADYETYLEFWIYGPTEDLFNSKLANPEYILLVEDVMYFLQVRGVDIGFKATNEKVQKIAIKQAKDIFKKYKFPKNSKFQYDLGNSLKRFLQSGYTKNADLEKIANALFFEYKSDNLTSDRLELSTISELNQIKNGQTFKKQEIINLFDNAQQVCDPVVLQTLFRDEKNRYSADIDIKIQQIDKQIQITKYEQERIKQNITTLNSAFKEIKRIDHEFTSIQPLYNDYLKISKSPQTYVECNDTRLELNNVKDNLISEITTRTKDLDNESKTLSSKYNFEQACDASKQLLGWGVATIVVTIVGTFVVSNFNSLIAPLVINFNPQPYSCPSNTQVYRSGESQQRYVILICSSENSSTTPKYYVGYDRVDKTKMTLTLDYAENNVFIANNKNKDNTKYIYKANFSTRQVEVTFPDGNKKTSPIQINNQSNSDIGKNNSGMSQLFYLLGCGIFITGIIRFLMAFSNKTVQNNQANKLDEKSQQLNQVINTIEQGWK